MLLERLFETFFPRRIDALSDQQRLLVKLDRMRIGRNAGDLLVRQRHKGERAGSIDDFPDIDRGGTAAAACDAHALPDIVRHVACEFFRQCGVDCLTVRFLRQTGVRLEQHRDRGVCQKLCNNALHLLWL